MSSLALVIQLIFCMLFGYVLAPYLRHNIRKISLNSLGYFSYALLLVMSFECMHYLSKVNNWSDYVIQSLIYASTMTLVSFSFCWFIFYALNTPTENVKVSLRLVLNALINMTKALLAIGIGICIYFTPFATTFYWIDSWYLLLIFMVLIGIDSRGITIQREWLNLKTLLLPFSAIVGSAIAAFFLYFCYQTDIPLGSLLALSQGHGFYSMSGIVLSRVASPEMGTLALMTDLFRELFAILLLYCFGWRYPRSSICAAGATSMDATLPMIKQSCGSAFLPYALISGLILTLLAPVLVSVLASI